MAEGWVWVILKQLYHQKSHPVMADDFVEAEKQDAGWLQSQVMFLMTPTFYYEMIKNSRPTITALLCLLYC